MKKQIFIFLSLLFTSQLYGQSFEPAPGNPGTTAIHKDSSAFVAWANGIEFQRGFLNVSDKDLGSAAFGEAENALYQAEGNSFDVVSFGDSGVAMLTFEYPIYNGDGFDFAVFENGFTDGYIEYAFVEVSSDGLYFVRFPAFSETPADVQMGNFEFSDCRYVHNLAGKYRQGYGTPFDLGELADSANLDVNHITHVKIIDVIGSVDPLYGSFDAAGTIINDPWPSEFESGGFDLDGVGVIHQAVSGVFEEKFTGLITENQDEFRITYPANFSLNLTSVDGKLIRKEEVNEGTVVLEKRENKELTFLTIVSSQKTFLFKIFY